MSILELVPFDLLTSLLNEWTGVKDLAKFDTSCSVSSEREFLLNSLSKITISVSDKSDHFLFWINKRKLKLKSLFLLDCHFDNDGKLILTELNYSEIGDISFHNDCAVTRSEMARIINKCPKMLHYPCYNMRCSTILEVLKLINLEKVRNLTYINLDISLPETAPGGHFIDFIWSNESIEYLILQCKNLEKINFGETISISHSIRFIQNNPNLISIDHHCDKASDVLMLAISCGCPLIQTIRLWFSADLPISAHCMKIAGDILGRKNNLYELQLGSDLLIGYFKCHKISGKRYFYVKCEDPIVSGQIQWLIANTTELKLQHIVLHDTFNSLVLMQIAQVCWQSLEQLELHNSCQYTADSLSDLLLSCPRLTELKLNMANQLTEADLTTVFVNTQHKLTHLHFRAMKHMTNAIVIAMLSENPQIKVLAFRKARQVNWEPINSFLVKNGMQTVFTHQYD